MSATVTVLYSCKLCGIERAPCAVPERLLSEDIGDWMKQTLGPALSRDHDQRSPGCKPDQLREVMIPMTGTDRIGGVTKH